MEGGITRAAAELVEVERPDEDAVGTLLPARSDRLHHRFDVGAAAIEFKIAVAQRDIGLFDFGFTSLQVRRHTVE